MMLYHSMFAKFVLNFPSKDLIDFCSLIVTPWQHKLLSGLHDLPSNSQVQEHVFWGKVVEYD